MKLLEVKDLKTYFDIDLGVVKAVDGVSFSIDEGRTLGIVGESGCGKSMTSLSIMHLLPSNGRIAGGQILFKGKDLAPLTRAQMGRINGNAISMVFQEPMTSLNPVFTVGDQIDEVLLLHEKCSRKEAREQTITMIRTVGIPRPEDVYRSYPHELSGGQRQRIMIAMALACNPSLLIADEPTTALDVTIQAQILDLLRKMKDEFGMSIMLITHDLGVIAEMADDVVVMYAGRVVERAPVRELFSNPSHPYTKGLLQSKPSLHDVRDRLYSIPGQVPNLLGLPEECHFADRCKHCTDKCRRGFPPVCTVSENHTVACTLYEEVQP
ncbi:ABC transporter ATP-binding protein [Ethanoligenens harbinense]|uniref:ABC transporter ATP-binding protein n=1 Tax=Ethanoligenens harbinense TaxID=253239 RepID=UPI000EA099E4|nr:ABC transporter ATP-binding protein [Ethanoligenens harbinense]AYF41764.1 dipeptide/oligopeptide/nickel ABC transporter ATP-binding protein [Ethanoligenens harbinense]